MYTLNQLKEYIDAHTEQFVIHCDSEEKAQEYLFNLSELGYIWSANMPIAFANIVHTRWKDKKAETCYTFIPGNKILLTARKKFYENKGFDVIEYDDFVNSFTQITNGIEENDVQPLNTPVSDEIVSKPVNSESKQEDNKQTSSVNDDEYIFCVNCGARIKKNSKFCIYCGTKNENIEQPDIISNNSSEQPDNTEEKAISNADDKNVSTVVQTTEPEENIDTSLINTISDKEQESTMVETNVFSTNEDLSEKDETTELNIFKILNLKPYEEFKIIGLNREYFDKKIVYRFNKDGFREKKCGDNLWFIAENEQELLYLINNPDVIQKNFNINRG